MLTGETFFKFFEDNPEISKEEISIIAKKMENYFDEQIISTEKDDYTININYSNKRCIYYTYDKSFSFVDLEHSCSFTFLRKFNNNNFIKKISTPIEESIIKNNNEKISADFVF